MSTDFVAATFPVLSDRGLESVREAEQRAAVRGHAAGYAAGHREAEAELSQRARQMDDALAGLTAARHAEVDGVVRGLDDVRAAIETQLVGATSASAASVLLLAVELAEAIVGRSLADERATAEAALARVMAAADDDLVLEVRLNPADLELLPATVVGDVRLVADTSLARGDARASLDSGGIDARLGTAIRRVRDELADGAA